MFSAAVSLANVSYAVRHHYVCSRSHTCTCCSIRTNDRLVKVPDTNGYVTAGQRQKKFPGERNYHCRKKDRVGPESVTNGYVTARIIPGSSRQMRPFRQEDACTAADAGTAALHKEPTQMATDISRVRQDLSLSTSRSDVATVGHARLLGCLAYCLLIG